MAANICPKVLPSASKQQLDASGMLLSPQIRKGFCITARGRPIEGVHVDSYWSSLWNLPQIPSCGRCCWSTHFECYRPGGENMWKPPSKQGDVSKDLTPKRLARTKAQPLKNVRMKLPSIHIKPKAISVAIKKEALTIGSVNNGRTICSFL